jgi:hypothetical protein
MEGCGEQVVVGGQPGRFQVDEDAAGRGDVAEVGEQAVADVDHGRGAQVGRLRARVVRRFRAAVGGDQGMVRQPSRQPSRQQGQAGGGAAERAGHRDQVAGGRAGTEHRGTAGQVAQDRGGQQDGAGPGGVPADHAGAGPGALGGQAGGQVSDPADRQVARRGQRDQEAGGHRAHGGHVDQAPGRGLAADVRRAGPVPAEVPPLEQEVRAGHHPAVGRGQDRRVVPDPDRRARIGRQPPRQRRDETELPEFGHGRIVYGYLPCVPAVWTTTVA